MKKIPTAFVRDFSSQPAYVTDQVTPGCEWVLKGEGVATRKYDGTCVMYDGDWWARREVKPRKNIPYGFVAVEHDEVTGKLVGWEPIEQSAFAKFFHEAREALKTPKIGTYELCGPKVNRNPEGYGKHELVRHADADVLAVPERTFEALREFVTTHADLYEGIVFHHPDGRMAKLKARDFPRSD